MITLKGAEVSAKIKDQVQEIVESWMVMYRRQPLYVWVSVRTIFLMKKV